MKVGIGSPDQERVLREAGCDDVFTTQELEDFRNGVDMARPLRLETFFRPEDTVVMIQPGYLSMPLMRKIAACGCWWQVPGHEPMRFNSDDDRASWRRQRPRGLTVPQAETANGRPNKYPIPTPEQVAAFLADWNSSQKRSLVVERMQARMGVKVPSHWCRDLARKHQGHTKRNKE